MTDFADYTPVVLRKEDPKINAANNRYQGSTEKKVEQKAEEGSFRVTKFPADFIQKIKTFRTNQKLNQQQFAQKLGITTNTIRDIENNSATYQAATIQKINNFISRAEKK